MSSRIILHPGEHETFEPGKNRLPPRAYNLDSNAKSLSLNGSWTFRLCPTAYESEDFAQLSSTDELAKRSGEGGIGWKPGDVLPSRQELLDAEPQNEVGEWGQITVPSHWVLQGYGLPAYTNVNFPFPCDPPCVPTENPTGDYLKSFNLPEDFAMMVKDGTVSLCAAHKLDSANHSRLGSALTGSSPGSRYG